MDFFRGTFPDRNSAHQSGGFVIVAIEQQV